MNVPSVKVKSDSLNSIFKTFKEITHLGNDTMTNLDSILKSRDITLPTKVCLVKAIVFPVVMYGCESWTIKKAEHWRMMLLNCGVGEDSWESLGLQWDPTSPSSRKSVLNIHWKDWCWSWRFNTWAPDAKNTLLGKYPDAGKERRQEEKVWQRTRWLDGITDSMDMSLSNFWEIVKNREAWHAAVHGVTKGQTWLSNWTTAIISKNSSDVACKDKYVKAYLHWLFFQNEFSHLLLYKLNSFYPLNPDSRFCLYTGKFLHQHVCKPIPFKVCLFLSVNLLAPQAPATSNIWCQ